MGGASTSNAPAIFTFDDVPTDEQLQQRRPSFRQQTRSAPPIPRSTAVAVASTSGSNILDTPGASGYESVFLASSLYPQNGESSRSNGVATSSR